MSQTPSAPFRDDFPQSVKNLLAQRAGFICAFPGCGNLTVGPSEDRRSGLSMVGVAAHITAASPNGPRYDASMSPEERSSERNGIWLCQTHGKLVDDNAKCHTVAELQRWKTQHEKWVFSRVANVDNYVHNGIAKVVLQKIGVFTKREEVKLGKHNIIYGKNSTGKSTFCQALSALSGSKKYSRFVRRFGHLDPQALIEVGCAHENSLTTVRITEQQDKVPGRRNAVYQRVHIEVEGNVAAYWPNSLFNVTMLDDQMDARHNRPKSLLRRTMQALAAELDMPEPLLWDALRDEMFMTSPLGFRFRRTGNHSVDVRVPGGRQFYLPFNLLSGGESVLAAIDVTLKLMMTDMRRNPWLLIIDTGFFGRLSGGPQQLVVDALRRIDDPFVQTILCVDFEDELHALQGRMSDNWIGATKFGDLTIHSFI